MTTAIITLDEFQGAFPELRNPANLKNAKLTPNKKILKGTIRDYLENKAKPVKERLRLIGIKHQIYYFER